MDKCGQCEFAEGKEVIAVAKYDDEYYCADCVCYNNTLQERDGEPPIEWEWVKPVIYYTIEDYNMTQSDEYPDPSVWVIDCKIKDDDWEHDEIHFVKIEDKESEEE